jgi:hypothetical protein
MALYGGIDLHANNSVVVILNEQDPVIYQPRFANQLPTILEQLAPYHPDLKGVVVESTYTWYWLVDGLMEADDRVHVANPAAMQQYSGLQYTDDRSDARWLAHGLRLGVLPAGYIYPKAERAVRALWRKRAPWVRQHTAQILRVQHLMARTTGARFNPKRIIELTPSALQGMLPEAAHVLAITSSLAVVHCLRPQSNTLEKTVNQPLKPPPRLCAAADCRGYWEDIGTDDWAGNGRYWPLPERGPLRLGLPVCGEHERQEREADRSGQCHQWPPLSRVGL